MCPRTDGLVLAGSGPVGLRLGVDVWSSYVSMSRQAIRIPVLLDGQPAMPHGVFIDPDHRGSVALSVGKIEADLSCEGVDSFSLVASAEVAGFRFPAEVIVVAVRWYLRYNLSYRDVEELTSAQAPDAHKPAVYAEQSWGRRVS